MAAKKDKPALKIAAANRRARFNYEIGQTYEAGIALTGTEVKSLREGRSNIADSYAGEKRRRAVALQRLHPGIPAGQPLQPRDAAAAEAAPPQARDRPARQRRAARGHDRRAAEDLLQRPRAGPRSSWRSRAARSSTTSATPRRSATGTAKRGGCSGRRGDAGGRQTELPLDHHRLLLARRGGQSDRRHGRGGLPSPRHRGALRQLRGAAREARRRGQGRAGDGLGRLQLLDPAQGQR